MQHIYARVTRIHTLAERGLRKLDGIFPEEGGQQHARLHHGEVAPDARARVECEGTVSMRLRVAACSASSELLSRCNQRGMDPNRIAAMDVVV